MSRNRIAPCIFPALMAAALLFAACSSPRAITVVSPGQGATVSLQNEGQREYLSLPRDERRERFADESYRKRMREIWFWPATVNLSWSDDGAGADTVYEVELFRAGDAEPVFTTNVAATSVEVGNLEIARDYRWTVRDQRGGPVAEGRFATEDAAPRFMKAGKLDNFRDLGGRIGLDGRRVRQGMVYRNVAFNYNADTKYYSFEEAIAQPELRAKVAPLLEEAAVWRARASDPAGVKILPIGLSEDWTLFLPQCQDKDEYAKLAGPALDGLRDVPGEFLGAKGEPRRIADGESIFLSGHFQAKGPAVLMQRLEAPEDGYVAMSAGGDYWWSVTANGQEVADLIEAGNFRSPYCPTNFTFLVPVRAGDNLISVAAFTGSGGWSWGCKSLPGMSPEDGATAMADFLRELARQKVGKVVKERIKGGERLDGPTKDYLRNVIGIKTDIDLRSDGECYGMELSPLGPAVKWVQVSSGCYGGMATEFGREAFKKVFPIFLDEANYPIDFHCIAGQDRTGAVACIINGLLGVQEDELYKDWESTGFWNPSVNFNHARLFDHLIEVFDAYPGETLNDRIEAYVLDLGFTRDDIAKLRSIMLE